MLAYCYWNGTAILTKLTFFQILFVSNASGLLPASNSYSCLFLGRNMVEFVVYRRIIPILLHFKHNMVGE